MKTAYCKRPARYVVGKTLWNEDVGRLDWELCRSSDREAMFCKQHAREQAQRYNVILNEARAWAKEHPEHKGRTS
jgi:hypothetical protein